MSDNITPHPEPEVLLANLRRAHADAQRFAVQATNRGRQIAVDALASTGAVEKRDWRLRITIERTIDGEIIRNALAKAGA